MKPRWRLHKQTELRQQALDCQEMLVARPQLDSQLYGQRRNHRVGPRGRKTGGPQQGKQFADRIQAKSGIETCRKATSAAIVCGRWLGSRIP
jgi:hypothetical protein